jgi:curved DNA-binding protein CbpA
MEEDLYALLGVRPDVKAAQLRKAYEWTMTTRSTPERRAAVARAYTVLADHRLRAEYDRGRVVGVGLRKYWKRSGG